MLRWRDLQPSKSSENKRPAYKSFVIEFEFHSAHRQIPITHFHDECADKTVSHWYNDKSRRLRQKKRKQYDKKKSIVESKLFYQLFYRTTLVPTIVPSPFRSDTISFIHASMTRAVLCISHPSAPLFLPSKSFSLSFTIQSWQVPEFWGFEVPEFLFRVEKECNKNTQKYELIGRRRTKEHWTQAEDKIIPLLLLSYILVFVNVIKV